MNLKKLRVACVVDAPSRRSARAGRYIGYRYAHDADVARALGRIFSDTAMFPIADEKVETIGHVLEWRPDVIFNLSLPGLGEEPGLVGMLENLAVPFTGSGSLGMILTRNRLRAAQRLADAGVPVPAVCRFDLRHSAPPFSAPWMLKLVHSAGSIGISKQNIASNIKQLRAAAQGLRRAYPRLPLLCEQFISGRELRVYLLERHGKFHVHAISELSFPSSENGNGIATSMVKFDSRYREKRGIGIKIADLDGASRHTIARIAMLAAHTLEIRGYAAIDFRIDPTGQPYIIDANANPGLSPRNIAWSKPSFSITLLTIVDAAPHGCD